MLLSVLSVFSLCPPSKKLIKNYIDGLNGTTGSDEFLGTQIM
jgi:hypothetical protein